jgi:hypothetical protein
MHFRYALLAVSMNPGGILSTVLSDFHQHHLPIDYVVGDGGPEALLRYRTIGNAMHHAVVSDGAVPYNPAD